MFHVSLLYVSLKSFKTVIKVIRLCNRLDVLLKMAAPKFLESSQQELNVEITFRKAVKN